MKASRLLSGFYIINITSLLLYFLPRTLFVFDTYRFQSSFPSIAAYVLRERQAFGLLALSLAFKLYRRRSWDETLLTTFVYTKAVQIWFIYMIDPRISMMFGLLYLVMYAMMWPPYYDGPRSYGKPLVPDHFHSQVMPSSGPPSGFWLVMFTIYGTFESIAVLPLFDELATEFSGRVSFGEVDVGSWKELAEHFKISTKSADQQIPTLVLFENGKEIRRLSPAAAHGQLKVVLTRKHIVSYFNLKEPSQGGKTKRR